MIVKISYYIEINVRVLIISKQHWLKIKVFFSLFVYAVTDDNDDGDGYDVDEDADGDNEDDDDEDNESVT